MDNLADAVAKIAELDAKRLQYEWKYDQLGQFVTGSNGDASTYTRICDIRGWGHLTGGAALNLPSPVAAQIQDDTGEFIAQAPTMASIIATLWQEREQQRAVMLQAREVLERSSIVTNVYCSKELRILYAEALAAINAIMGKE